VSEGFAMASDTISRLRDDDMAAPMGSFTELFSSVVGRGATDIFIFVGQELTGMVHWFLGCGTRAWTLALG
jgi:hypothetical protein